MGWKTYDAMSRIEKKMYWAVREETMLQELPWPEIDDPRSPREVRWPAEDPDDCATVLLGWFDAGLITVMTTGGHDYLGSSEARALLTGPAGWSPSHSLVLTDRGEELLEHAGLA
ncbi:hypothetical protein [Nocardioides sp. 503]|uniref:hypothetical protein n=1 Tax=Nocardioides sp. 503 TaxID=2508326 RepID=UPI001070506A|nr:hypothetical protein [Nocardioides sp. 503]